VLNKFEGFTTHIILPTMVPVDAEEILKHLTPESLLFLRRVRVFRLVVEDGLTTVLSLQRSTEAPIATAVCEIDVNGVKTQTRRFFVADDLESSSVRVAIPDPSWFDGKTTFPFSTFLPVSDVGFPFVVQGDFCLTANREDVHEADSFNLMLRSRIAPTVFRALMSVPELQDNLALYVPPNSSISSSWWRCCLLELRELVKSSGLIESFDGIQRPVRLSVVVSDEILAVVPAVNIYQATGFAPVSLSWRERASQVFGCKSLSVDMFGDCLVAFADDCARPVSWYSSLYVALGSFDDARTIVPSLVDAKLFCDTSGECFSLSDATPLISSDPLESDLIFGSSVPLLNPSTYGDPRAKLCLTDVFGVQVAGKADISGVILEWHLKFCAEENRNDDASLVAWISSHLRWFSRRGDNMARLKRCLVLPCLDYGRRVFVVASLAYFEPCALKEEDLNVPYPVLDPALKSGVVRKFLVDLGVNQCPRLVQLETVMVPSPELQACWRWMKPPMLLTMLFENWPYYRVSGEVLALVQQMQVPILPTVFDAEERTCSWFLAFEKDPAWPKELAGALPVLDCDLGVHRDLIAGDLGIKCTLTSSASSRFVAMQEWLIRHEDSTSLELWNVFYRYAHSLSLPCGSWVFVPRRVLRENVLNDSVFSIASLSNCVWDGVAAVSKWCTNGSVVLSALYPELKPFFCPPVALFPSVRTVVDALRNNWLDKSSTSKFRDVTEASVPDIAKLYQMCAEFSNDDLSDGLVREIPVLNQKLRFFSSAKAERLVRCDDPVLKKELRIPSFLSLHDCIPASLADRLNVPRLSELAVSSLVNPEKAKSTPELSFRFRSFLKWLKKFFLLQDELVDTARIDVAIDRLKVYQCAGKFVFVSTAVEIPGDGKNTIFRKKYNTAFLWIKQTFTLVIPKEFEFFVVCQTICASIGGVELRMFLKMQKANLLNERMLDEETARMMKETKVAFSGVQDFPKFVASVPSESSMPKGKAAVSASGSVTAPLSNLDGDLESDGRTTTIVMAKRSEPKPGNSAPDGQKIFVEYVGRALNQLRDGASLSEVTRKHPFEEKTIGRKEAGRRDEPYVPSTRADQSGLLELESEFSREIGSHGELFLNEWLLKLPLQLSVRWISSFAFQNGSCKEADVRNGCGYDMVLTCASMGQLQKAIASDFPQGRRKSGAATNFFSSKVVSLLGSISVNTNEFFVEVKAHSFDLDSFVVSSNELDVLRREQEKYMIVVVGLLPRPSIVAVLFNPAKLLNDGAITARPSAFLVERKE
jgi:hypothetical protein